MKPKSILGYFFALAGSALMAVSSAHAATLYWDVDGSTIGGFGTVVGAWNGSSALWNTDVAGGAGGSVTATTTTADDLIIAPATTNTGSITVSTTRNASSITFAPNVGPTATITGGTAIVIGGTGSSSGIFQQSTGGNTVSTALTLKSDITAFNFSNSNSGLLTIGAVTGAASTGTQTVTVGSSSTGGITLNGIIGNGAAGGKVALKISNSTGVTTLSGNNTFTGGLAIEAGTVSLSGTTAAGAGLVTLGGVGTFGTLDINGATRDIHSLATAGTAANQIIGNGSTSTNSTLNYTGASTSDFGGVIQNTVGSGNRALSLTLNNASANLTLSGATSNTYTLGTTVTAGTLVLNKSGTANAIGGTALTINGGVVQYHSSAGTNQIGDTAIVTVSGGTFNMNSKSDTLGGLVYNSGTISNVAGPLILTNNSTATLSMRNTTINFDIAFSNTAGNTNGLTFDATNNGTATISGGINMNNTATTAIQRIFTVNNGTAAVDMEVSGVISATTSTILVKLGDGTLVLSGANTYDGATTIGGSAAGGVLQISTIGNVSGGATNLGAPTTAANGIIGIRNSTLRYVGTAAETDRQITNAGVSATSTIDQSGTGLLKFTNSNFWSSVALGGGTMILKLQGSTTGTGEISGIISNGGRTVNVTKDGTGTWTLSGANTYTGTTTVSNGTLLTTKAAALPGYNAASKVSVASGATLAVRAGVTLGTQPLLNRH